jgi:ADP-ribosyl-[dinitrogen reductase] hydrolase
MPMLRPVYTGQLAGAYYGVSAIPQGRLNKLTMRDAITEIALGLFTHRYQPI